MSPAREDKITARPSETFGTTGTTMTWLRRTLLALCALVILFAVALVLGEHYLKRPLERLLSVHARRDIRFQGTFDARLLSLHPTIRASQVTIGNPPWMPPGTMANVGSLSLTLAWQVSLPPLTIQRLEMQHATLHLLRDSRGRANWQMHEAVPGSGPPLIRSLSMPHAHVELNDDRRHLQFSGTVSAGDASAMAASSPFRIEGSGQLNGRAASFAIDGDPLLEARRGHLYHFVLEEQSVAAQLVGRGVLLAPFDLRALQGTFAVQGSDMRDLYYLVGLRLPHTGPFHLSGALTRQGTRFVYSDLRASSGKSDMSGMLTVNSSNARPRIEGQLSSELLRPADLGDRAAGITAQGSNIVGRHVADTPFRLEAMRRVDAAVQFRARVLAVGHEELHSVSALVALNHGVLSIDGFRGFLGEGTISGRAQLDASREVPRGELSLNIADLPLDQFKGRSGVPPFIGSLGVRASLSGRGKSFHELAGAVNGNITAVLPHGSMRTSIADVASLNFIDALGALLKSREQTSVRCGVASFDAHDGQLTVRTFAIDTAKVLITGSGEVRMDSGSLDLTLLGQPKDARLALRSGISIRGTLGHVQIKRVGHNALAAAVKAVLAPVAALLNVVDPKHRYSDCPALLGEAQTDTPETSARPPAPH